MSGLKRSASMSSRLRRILPYFRRDVSGVAAIEFALLAMPFFLIVFAILETSAVFMGEMTLNQAVAHASRLVRTGQIATSSMTEPAFKQKICDEITILLSCDGITVDLQAYAKFADIPTTAPVSNGLLNSSGFKFETVNPGQIMAVRAFYKWPLYADIFRKYLSNMSDGSYLMTAVVVLKTEPFSGK